MNSEVELTAEQMAAATGGVVCPACGGGELERFFEIAELPVNCIALSATREAALECPKGRIELGFCLDCGAVSNLAFDAACLSYDRSYDNSLHFSPTFQKYAEEVAGYLIERYELRGKSVVDVGCGNGEFLALVCGLGKNRGVGFDPSFIPGRANLRAGKGISIVPDYYSERHAHHDADCVVCRQVLEHIFHPQQFLRGVRGALTGKPDAAVFFEVPNASFVFRAQGMWDIIYEHCFYYSSGALARLFSGCGFDVLKVSETFGGQYLCLEARVSGNETGALGDTGGDLAAMRGEILRFADDYRASRLRWGSMLGGLAAEGKRVVLWGAGAKGAMFLNAFRDASSLQYIVDVNPHKRGLYIPGTGQKVVDPEFLREYRPEVVLIVNPNYREEIGRQISALGLGPELISI